jgi:lipopolysaccharide biosynthesis protein
MFWVRPLALTPLRGLRLANAFAPEAGLSDGALEHAVEGLFNHSVRLAGFQVAGVSAG